MKRVLTVWKDSLDIRAKREKGDHAIIYGPENKEDGGGVCSDQEMR